MLMRKYFTVLVGIVVGHKRLFVSFEDGFDGDLRLDKRTITKKDRSLDNKEAE